MSRRAAAMTTAMVAVFHGAIYGGNPALPTWPSGQACIHSHQRHWTPRGLPASWPLTQQPGQAEWRHAGTAVCLGGTPAASPVQGGAADSGADLVGPCGPEHGSAAGVLGERRGLCARLVASTPKAVPGVSGRELCPAKGTH